MHQCLKIVVTFVTFCALTVPSQAEVTTWAIDPIHTTAAFKVRHMMVTWVRGEFGRVEGTVQYDPQRIEATHVDVAIDVSTLDTRDRTRDTDLRGPAFLDVARFPTITFQSKRVQNVQLGSFELVGDLTIHGVRKETVLQVEGSSPEVRYQGNVRRGTSASTTINRQDFGLTWNRFLETGGVLVGDEVHITIEVELVQRPLIAGSLYRYRLDASAPVPASGYQVYLYSPSTGWTGPVSTPIDGRYVFASLPSGRYFMRIYNAFGSPVWQQDVQMPGVLNAIVLP
ncbi:MAG: YceI family protein [Candidatus Tectomicrobia bacterium]|nr:YceI family protein [Candidatus Tectomicrobia bacterium]